jgi:hypothetical protein
MPVAVAAAFLIRESSGSAFLIRESSGSAFLIRVMTMSR